jgi:hypothetical protein
MLMDGSYRRYHRMPIWYNYGSQIDQLLLEAGEVYTQIGIISQIFETGFVQYKIPCIFEEANICLQILRQIYYDTALYLHANRGSAKIKEYPSPFDDNNNIALNLYYKEPWGEKTLFTDPKGNPVSWDLLVNVRIKFIPLLRIKHIHIMNGTASLEMEIVSAVITALESF